ncbi:hypothetical protein, partial [Desulfobacula sp.]
MIKYMNVPEVCLTYKVAINQFKIKHSFDVNSIMLENEFGQNSSIIELSGNLLSPNFDLRPLVKRKKITIKQPRIQKNNFHIKRTIQTIEDSIEELN